MLAFFTKRLTARLAVLSIVAAGSLAAAPAQAEFRGGGIIFDYVGCEAYGWQPTDQDPVRARYGPSEEYGNPSSISLFFPHGGAMNVAVNADLVPGRTRYRGPGRGIFRTFWTWDTRPRVRVAERTVVLPRNETFANALVVDLRLRVINFAGLAGCSATVGLSLHRN